ncbi:MAG: hypothetical protein K2X03_15650 [Bryobacteraceae bacterium]|nr:hypothetical protein [Bryobacteraceae bacterium]
MWSPLGCGQPFANVQRIVRRVLILMGMLPLFSLTVSAVPPPSESLEEMMANRHKDLERWWKQTEPERDRLWREIQPHADYVWNELSPVLVPIGRMFLSPGSYAFERFGFFPKDSRDWLAILLISWWTWRPFLRWAARSILAFLVSLGRESSALIEKVSERVLPIGQAFLRLLEPKSDMLWLHAACTVLVVAPGALGFTLFSSAERSWTYLIGGSLLAVLAVAMGTVLLRNVVRVAVNSAVEMTAGKNVEHPYNGLTVLALAIVCVPVWFLMASASPEASGSPPAPWDAPLIFKILVGLVAVPLYLVLLPLMLFLGLTIFFGSLALPGPLVYFTVHLGWRCWVWHSRKGRSDG